MKKILFTSAILLHIMTTFAQTNPVITSWLQNTTTTGRHYVSGNTTPIADVAIANVQTVRYSTNYVYINTNGIPTYITGPYLDGNPSLATAQNAIFKLPLNPVQNTGTLTNTTGGNIGLFINGVALFDYRDGVSWQNSTNSLKGGPLGGTGDGVWNRDAVVGERGGFDCSKAHPAMGNYHHHQNPSAFNLDLNIISNICSTYPSDGLYKIDSTKHSPLIGFTYDGFPIYGAYAYKNIDGTGGIVRMKSSYTLRNITTRTTYSTGATVTAGPAVSATYPLGYFREDYQYNTTSSATPDYLDEHNGRFCKTPEYPNGIYCYFATVGANWNSEYPYLVGPTFYGTKVVTKVTSITETVTTYFASSVSIASSSSSVCSGTSVTFTATPTNGGTNPTYQWKKNGSNVGTSSTTYIDNTLANGDIITCVMTTSTSASATSNSITMTVNAAVTPSVAISTANTTICAGTNITFIATPTNGGTSPTYQWKKNGTNVGIGGTSYSNNTLSNGDAISCELTSNANCASSSTATSNSVTMIVNTIVTPAVSISSTSNTICSGTNVTFTAMPTNGGTTPSYQWKKNGTNVGSGSTTYSNNALANGDVISCVMTSNASCASTTTATSNSVTMIVNTTVIPALSISATSTTICSGTNVTFTAVPTNGGTAPSYQWKKNGNNVGTGGTSYSNNTLANGESITCVMTSNASCASTPTAISNSVTIIVNTTVTPAVSISSTSNTVCSGTNVTFTATPTNGGTTPTYQWKKNGTNIGSGSTTYSSNTLANGDIITCVMTSNANCATSSTATSNSITMTSSMSVTPAISISATSSAICSGTNVTFTATPTNGGTTPTYQWKKNGTNVGTGGSTYSNNALANGDIISCELTSNASCVSTTTATSNSVTMIVNTSVIPTVSISATSSTICSGTNVTFTAIPTNGGTAPSYQWKKNGNNIGIGGTTYSNNALANGDVISCVMTSNVSCASTTTATSNSITMVVNATITPSVSISASSSIICSGTNVTFTAIPTNGGTTPTYQWKKNGNNIGTASPSYSNNALSNGDIITCVMTSNASCASTNTGTSNSVIMTVNATVTPTVSISTPATTISSGATVIFTAISINAGNNPSYQWKKNANNVGSNSSTYTDSSLLNDDAISCILTSNAACASSATANSNIINMTVNTTTGIHENSKYVYSLMIVPVPAFDYVVIQISNLNRENLNITLYDLTGRQIEQTTLYQGSTMAYFDVRTLYNGEYIVKISGNEGNVIKKVLVQHN